MSSTAHAAVAEQPSFFARVETELRKLFTHAPGWEASASATLTYVAPLVETVVLLVDPAIAPTVSGLIGKIQSAMAAAAVVVKDAGPTPTLITYLNAINNDITQIAGAVGISDPAVSGKLKATLATITGEIDAMLAQVNALPA